MYVLLHALGFVAWHTFVVELGGGGMLCSSAHISTRSTLAIILHVDRTFAAANGLRGRPERVEEIWPDWRQASIKRRTISIGPFELRRRGARRRAIASALNATSLWVVAQVAKQLASLHNVRA